jgi:hypothetical protein
MAKASTANHRLARLALGGCLLLGAVVAPVRSAPPTVSKMLEYAPRQEVVCTTPSAAEVPACKVDLDKGLRGGSGWVLKDPSGKLLRRFYASNDRNVDTWSYYKDGVEVYREMDTTGSGRPDQFRWLNAGGSKWGVDADKDGKIDTWRVISPEEVSQEVLRALATRNLARLQALLITEDEVKALGLSSETAAAIREKRAGAKAKFEAAIAKLTKLTEKASWVHLETAGPECIPAEQAGGKTDVLRQPRGTVLFESSGANDWFQTGPMYLVGAAWKLIDAPTPGTNAVEESTTAGGPRTMDLDPKVQKLVQELTDLDKKGATVTGSDAVKHHLYRADILEKIVAAVPGKERDPWIRQVADSLATAAQASSDKETVAATRLLSLEKQLLQYMPGSNLAAYIVFRRLQADNNRRMPKDAKEFEKFQKDWRDQLTTFVRTYPKADDVPDAMLQLGTTCEVLEKDVEAKNWYATLAKNYPGTLQGRKAEGAVRRLSLEGNVFTLSAPLLAGGSTPFDISRLKGKVVVVYYWASWTKNGSSEFTKLKALLSSQGKDVELVCVNLDATAAEAKAFVTSNAAPGTHVYAAEGLEGKLAIDYGVMALPALFIIGKDGKCLSRKAEFGSLEDEVKKHLKK